MIRQRQHHAVVIGASIGGLAAARVLAGRFEKVTILERDALPERPESRKGVPQAKHTHALLAGGAKALGGLFPGIADDLVAQGAIAVDFNEGRWHQAGGYRAPVNVDRTVVSASRPFIEHEVRRRVLALPNVTVETGVIVSGLCHDAERVRGVRVLEPQGSRSVVADLVVDCSGRSSRAHEWLTGIGYLPPALEEVRCDVRYGTVVLERNATDLDASFSVTIESPPDGKRAAILLPIEGDRWMATIAASFGERAPVDMESFRSIAASLPAPEMRQVIDRAMPLSPVSTHRLSSSRRRRYEKLSRVPAGFIALGDSLCSFNPIYGQGMSSAAMQAVELGACLDRYDNDQRLVRAFYKRAAKVIATPWQIAVGADFAYPECTGPRQLGTDFVNRYMRHVLLAARVSTEVNTEMVLVQNLLAPPAKLFRPSMFRKVLRASREAQRQPSVRVVPAPATVQTPANTVDQSSFTLTTVHPREAARDNASSAPAR
jgi:2-polyprenyl-6-methoxyphenol hydroxylase-like FAD-dependent oxidoreductase